MIILVCNHSEKENLNIDEMVWIETLCNYTDLLLECSNQIEDLLKQLQEINDFEQPPCGWQGLCLNYLKKKERILQVIYMMEFTRSNTFVSKI